MTFYTYRLYQGVYYLYRFNSRHTRQWFIDSQPGKWKKELPLRLQRVLDKVEWLPHGNYAHKGRVVRM